MQTNRPRRCWNIPNKSIGLSNALNATYINQTIFLPTYCSKYVKSPVCLHLFHWHKIVPTRNMLSYRRYNLPTEILEWKSNLRHFLMELAKKQTLWNANERLKLSTYSPLFSCDKLFPVYIRKQEYWKTLRCNLNRKLIHDLIGTAHKRVCVETPAVVVFRFDASVLIK